MKTAGLVGAIVLATLLTTSCADNSNPNVASVSGSPSSTAPGGEDAYSKCMRENGAEVQSQEIPNNGSGQGTAQQGNQSQADQEKQRAAHEKCRQHLPDGGNPKPMNPEQLDQARKFAKCMRDEGVAYPDPKPEDGGDGAAKLPDGVDVNDPVVQEKLRRCSAKTNDNNPGSSGSTK
ncbi:hypothetical protein ACIA8G_39615 [Lentzea sp. NPDC051213]|uniref:hypothetical protein n=1 Tax=Lentzea sp. NPDC051213 TaxID=3364126 RepID=UPI003788E75F